jgi:hypothetical protein
MARDDGYCHFSYNKPKMRLFYSIIVLFIYFSNNNLNAQQKDNWSLYYDLINQAEILHFRKAFVKADSVYSIAFETVEKPFKEDYYLAAKNLVLENNHQRAAKYLKLAISKGLSINRIKSDVDFRYFRSTALMQNLIHEINQPNQIPRIGSNQELDSKISYMVKRDQQIRGWRGLLRSSKKMNKVDRDHFKQLYEICIESGWPGISKIGEDTPKGKYDVTDNITLLLLHFSRKEVSLLEPFMREAVRNGEMYPYHYARTIDYKRIALNGKQWFGTYFNTKGSLIEIEDPLNVDERRKEIGMEPVSEYLLKNGK